MAHSHLAGHSSSKTKSPQLKFVVCGDVGAGKTSLLFCFREMASLQEATPTKGMDLFVKHLTIQERRVMAHFWDITGDAHSAELVNHYFKHAHGVIIVVDAAVEDKIACLFRLSASLSQLPVSLF